MRAPKQLPGKKRDHFFCALNRIPAERKKDSSAPHSALKFLRRMLKGNPTFKIINVIHASWHNSAYPNGLSLKSKKKHHSPVIKICSVNYGFCQSMNHYYVSCHNNLLACGVKEQNLWAVQDSNLWPLQCECSALPLS